MIEISKNQPDIQKINSFFITHYLPVFLGVEEIIENEDKTVHVIVSSNKFDKLTVDKRILNIFNLIKEKEPSILDSTKLIVEAYTWTELEDVLDYYV